MSEKDLREALRGVRAPDGLWESIAGRLDQPLARGGHSPHGLAIAACFALMAGVSWMALWGRASGEAALFRRVCGRPELLDVRTAELSEVRRWAASHGMTLRVAGSPASGIGFAGAMRLPDRGGIAVAYRVDGAWSALVVEPGRPTSAGKMLERRTVNGLTVFAWRSGSQRYTVVTDATRHAEKACGLCHAELPGRPQAAG